MPGMWEKIQPISRAEKTRRSAFPLANEDIYSTEHERRASQVEAE